MDILIESINIVNLITLSRITMDILNDFFESFKSLIEFFNF